MTPWATRADHQPAGSDPRPFIGAGQALFDLHLGYESAAPFPLVGLDVDADGDPYDFYRVEKMAFPKVRVDGKLVAEKTKIRYNSRIELSGIPEEVQRYELGPRTAVEWCGASVTKCGRTRTPASSTTPTIGHGRRPTRGSCWILLHGLSQ